MMATDNLIPAFGAFEAQLKTLCLQEFPCGIGTWRENHKKKVHLIEKDKVISKFSITLKDYGAGFEKAEALEELTKTKKSPWNLDYSWSDEAKELREIAVRSPWLIDERFVLSHFKTLRIVDKEVSDVDEAFLMFPNLTELTLSANSLRTINSKHLPQSLKVLELCANTISNLADLCMEPPPLMHLGLGHNLLTMVDDYITGEYWPNLLSLDLSYNNLSDLMDIVRKLQSLPKLRNIVLQGNPLSLVPGYRGYIIDSLRALDYLDDLSISADEKHHYKGLARRKEYILDEAKVHFSVDFIKGIPQPEELKAPEEQPEFPIVTKNYYVQFMYLEDKSANAEIFQLLHDDQYTATEDAQTLNTARDSLMVPSVATGAQDSSRSLPQGSQGLRSQVIESQLGGGTVSVADGGDTTARSQSIRPESEIDIGGAIDSQHTKSQDTLQSDNATTDTSGPRLRLAPVRSAHSTWQEEMELNWHQMLIRDDLLSLRDFFQEGMDIAVMEEKILSYPADQVQDGVLTPGGKDKGKGDKKKDDKKKDEKRRKKDPTPPPKKKEEPKPKKKKKGEPDIEMVHMPGEYTTIAKFHVPLEDFLEGDYEFENVYIKSWVSESGAASPVSDITLSARDKKEKKKGDKKKDKLDKDRKSPKVERKASDKDKPKTKPSAPEGDDEPPPPPPPLEVQVKISLHHWKTALDSVKEEEEKLRQDQIANMK